MLEQATPGGTVATRALIRSASTSRRDRGKSRFFLSLLASMSLMACGESELTVVQLDDPSDPPPALEDAEITLISGADQQGTVGAFLLEPLVVEVRDADGAVFPGATLEWSFGAGAGVDAVQQGAPAAVVRAITDSFGKSTVSWRLGTVAGAQEVSVQVDVPNPGPSGTSGPNPAPSSCSRSQSKKWCSLGAVAMPGSAFAVAIFPESPAISEGDAIQLAADVTDEYGNELADAPVEWDTQDEGIAQTDASGRVVGIAAGATSVVASSDGASGAQTVTVTSNGPDAPGNVTDLQVVTTTDNTITVNWTEVDDGDGGAASYALRRGSPTISWGGAYSTEVVVAGTQVGAQGSYTWSGLAAGTSYEFQLVAYRGTLNAGATFGQLSNVASGSTGSPPPVVTTVTVSPSGTVLDVGSTAQFSATVRDQFGSVMSVPVAWSTNDAAVLQVSQAGLASATGEGTTSVVATADGVIGQQSVTVREPVQRIPTSIELSGSALTLSVGSSQTLTATVLDQFQSAMPDTFDIVWSSNQSAVATVSQNGIVTAVAQGSAQIQAAEGSLSETAQVTVVEPGAALFSDDFESGDLSTSSNGSGWGSSDETGVVTNQVARSGTAALRFEFAGVPSGRDSSAEQRFYLGNQVTELWMEFWIYYPDGSEGFGPRYEHRSDSGSSNNKLFRVWGRDYSERNKWGASTGPDGGGDASVYPEHADNEGGMGRHGQPSYNNFVTDGTRGRWVQFRAHGRLATSGSAENGLIEIWWDGNRVIRAENLDMHDSTHNYWDAGYLLGWANSGFDQTTFVWIDDVRLFDVDPGW